MRKMNVLFGGSRSRRLIALAQSSLGLDDYSDKCLMLTLYPFVRSHRCFTIVINLLANEHSLTLGSPAATRLKP